MEVLEEMHLKVQQALYKLEAGDLKKLCGGLPEIEDVDGKTKRQLIRRILNHLESSDVADTEDSGMAVLLSLDDQIGEMLKEKKEDNDALKKQTEEEMKALAEAHKTQMAQLEIAFQEKLKLLEQKAEGDKKNNTLTVPVVGYKKDLRICGEIGSAAQKDRLSYSSLNHQIEVALKKGYKPEEVVEAVIKATNPGIPLRSVLEGEEMTLNRLKSILRSHYQEKGATELFQELSELTQRKSETPQEFILRAMDLKGKILKASAEAVTGPQYNQQQIQSVYINAIDTGLLNEAIRADIRPHLTEGTTDEVLLENLNIAVTLETKRQQKAGKKKVSVQQVKTNDPPQPSVQNKEISKLTEGLDRLTTLVMSLQEKTTSTPKSPPPTQDRQRRRPPIGERGCQRCREANKGVTCNHCFKCGDGNHFARGCKYAGNGRRSLQGDRK